MIDLHSFTVHNINDMETKKTKKKMQHPQEKNPVNTHYQQG